MSADCIMMCCFVIDCWQVQCTLLLLLLVCRVAAQHVSAEHGQLPRIHETLASSARDRNSACQTAHIWKPFQG